VKLIIWNGKGGMIRYRKLLFFQCQLYFRSSVVIYGGTTKLDNPLDLLDGKYHRGGEKKKKIPRENSFGTKINLLEKQEAHNGKAQEELQVLKTPCESSGCKSQA
jgi:hypothetical protein